MALGGSRLYCVVFCGIVSYFVILRVTPGSLVVLGGTLILCSIVWCFVVLWGIVW